MSRARDCAHRVQRIKRQPDGSRVQVCERCGFHLATLDDVEAQPVESNPTEQRRRLGQTARGSIALPSLTLGGEGTMTEDDIDLWALAYGLLVAPTRPRPRGSGR